MNQSKSDELNIGYLSVVAIGIGGMVGGGIIVLTTSYSHTKISFAYPGQGVSEEILYKTYFKIDFEKIRNETKLVLLNYHITPYKWLSYI